MTFDPILDGKDLIGRARTGMGKTLAFALPTIERMLKDGTRPARGRKPRTLVLAPTRELAKQVAEDFESCAPALTTLTVYGGTPMGPQVGALSRGVDIVVGTPGRVQDLLQQGVLKLDGVKHAILDEADRMLDMGFADDVGKILDACPALKNRREVADKESGNTPKRMKFSDEGENTLDESSAHEARAAARDASAGEVQVLLFSATLPKWVREVAAKYMIDPASVDLVGDDDNTMSASMHVQHLILQCPWQTKAATINDLIAAYSGSTGKTVIFCETKKEVNELCVSPDVKVECKPLHGDIAQAQRETTLKAFKNGHVRCIVATDVAARGLDIQGVDLVIMERPPAKLSGRADVEAYVHRSGRTGRAGRKGTCVTLYTRQQEPTIREIESATGNTFVRIGAPQAADLAASAARDAAQKVGEVEASVLSMFEEVAADLVSKHGAKEALERAIAVITGYTSDVPTRSLLSSSEGFTTVMWKSPPNNPLRVPSFAWNGLRRELSEEACTVIRGLRITADSSAAVFDVPAGFMDEIREAIQGGSKALEICKVLPEFRERADSSPAGRSSFGGRSGGRGGGRGGGGRGGYGGGRGGYGGGRGGGYGGGRGGYRGRG
jgi:ATP-dependent RNA helicase DDX21